MRRRHHGRRDRPAGSRLRVPGAGVGRRRHCLETRPRHHHQGPRPHAGEGEDHPGRQGRHPGSPELLHRCILPGRRGLRHRGRLRGLRGQEGPLRPPGARLPTRGGLRDQHLVYLHHRDRRRQSAARPRGGHALLQPGAGTAVGGGDPGPADRPGGDGARHRDGDTPGQDPRGLQTTLPASWSTAS